MRGYNFISDNLLPTISAPTEATSNSAPQFNGLEATFYNPILLALYVQREQRRTLFQRQILSRTIPEAVHSIPRQRFLENTND